MTKRPTVRPLDAEPWHTSGGDKFIGRTDVHHIADHLGAADRLEINGLSFEPGARSRPHSHDYDQVLYFFEGPGIVAVDGGEDQLIQPGEFVMLPANTPHMHGAPHTNPAAHVSIMAQGHSNDFDCPIPAQWEQYRAGRED
jgi:quercetin dioxygenase-like cupin family protein